jgi:hypothetical protein
MAVPRGLISPSFSSKMQWQTDARDAFDPQKFFGARANRFADLISSEMLTLRPFKIGPPIIRRGSTQ